MEKGKNLMKNINWKKIFGTTGIGILATIFIGLSIWIGFETNHIPIEISEIKGVTTTTTVINLTKNLLEKPGGLTYNDMNPLTRLYLDNIRYWEYGQVLALRDIQNVMRNYLSKAQPTSPEDPDLKISEPAIQFPIDSWGMMFYNNSEGSYEKSITHLENYLRRIQDDDKTDAQFYTRIDKLKNYLELALAKTGGYSAWLTSSVDKPQYNVALVGDSSAKSSTNTPTKVYETTSFFELDDKFFEARGYVFVLTHILKSFQIEFKEALEKKNATQQMRQIISSLESTQQSVYAPIISIGYVNQSIYMNSFLSQANTSMSDMLKLLEDG